MLRGSVSALVGPHSPSTPDTLSAAAHASQAPAHAFAQHTPSRQNPVSQSASAPHGDPWFTVSRNVHVSPDCCSWSTARFPAVANDGDELLLETIGCGVVVRDDHAEPFHTQGLGTST